MAIKTKRDIKQGIANAQARLQTMPKNTPAYQNIQNRLQKKEAQLRDFTPQIAQQPSMVEPPVKQVRPQMPAQVAPQAQVMGQPDAFQQAPMAQRMPQAPQMQMPMQADPNAQMQPEFADKVFNGLAVGRGGQLPEQAQAGQFGASMQHNQGNQPMQVPANNFGQQKAQAFSQPTANPLTGVKY
jgi:hypothetical protein